MFIFVCLRALYTVPIEPDPWQTFVKRGVEFNAHGELSGERCVA